jgi:hypothetical protein
MKGHADYIGPKTPAECTVHMVGLFSFLVVNRLTDRKLRDAHHNQNRFGTSQAKCVVACRSFWKPQRQSTLCGFGFRKILALPCQRREDTRICGITLWTTTRT